MESNYCMRIRCIIYIHACIVHALVRVYYVRVYIAVRPPPWPAFFATSHHSLDIDAFYIQSHLITKNSVDFLLLCKSPEGLGTLYLCTITLWTK